MKSSKRVAAMPASGIRAMFELASSYENVINLCIGEPDFDTPSNVVEAGVAALRSGYTKYVPNAGLPQLREAIAWKMRERNRMEVTADQVMVTFGAGQALMSGLQTLLDPGDEIILPDPCFPNYLGYVALAGATPVMVGTHEENAFHMSGEGIEKAVTGKTKAVLINSPCNPTGAVLSRAELEKIGEVAKEYKLTILSDEPYETILYSGKEFCSPASLPGMAEHVLTINSFSKSYAMTGWRVGYAVGPKHIVDAMTVLQESLSSCVNAASQMAAVEAIRGPQDAVYEMTRQYERRRKLLVKGLNEVPGFSCIQPEGAFYAFANIKDTGLSSVDLARELIEKVQVVATPGCAFGDCGEGYLRFSFAGSEETLQEGIQRMKRAMSSR